MVLSFFWWMQSVGHSGPAPDGAGRGERMPTIACFSGCFLPHCVSGVAAIVGELIPHSPTSLSVCKLQILSLYRRCLGKRKRTLGRVMLGRRETAEAEGTGLWTAPPPGGVL